MRRRPSSDVAASRPQAAQQAAFLYVGLGLGQRAISFVLIPFLTSTLSTDEYGTIAALTSLVALLGICLGLGLETAVFRGIAAPRPAADHAPYDAALRQFLMLWVPVIGIILAGFVWALGLTLAAGSPVAVALAILSGALSTSIYSYVLPVLRANEVLSRFALVSCVSIVAQFSTSIIFVLILDMGVIGWAIATLTSALVAYVVGWVALPTRLLTLRGMHHLVPSLRFTLPLLPHQMLSWSSSFVDRLIMIALVSASVVGIYSLAYQASMVLAMILLELNRALMPTYVRLGRRPGHDEVSNIVAIHRAIMLTITALAILAIPLASPLLFRGDFAESAQYLAPLFLAQLAYGFYFVPANLVTLARGKTGGIWLASLCGAFANVTLNLLLLKKFEAWGAVAATAIAYVAMVSVATALERKAARMDPPSVKKDRSVLVATLIGLAGVVIGAAGSSMGAQGTWLLATSAACLVLTLLGPVRLLQAFRREQVIDVRNVTYRLPPGKPRERP